VIGTPEQQGVYGEPLTKERGHLLLSLWQSKEDGDVGELPCPQYTNWVSKNLDFVAVRKDVYFNITVLKLANLHLCIYNLMCPFIYVINSGAHSRKQILER